MQDHTNGFTLLEILMVLAIISIIAIMAYPSYMSYFYKSNRLDAMTSLFHYHGLLQQCLLNTFEVDDCLSEIGIMPNGIRSLHQHYRISANTDMHTTLIAHPIEQQGHDQLCARFSLDDMGNKEAFDYQEQDTTHQCW